MSENIENKPVTTQKSLETIRLNQKFCSILHTPVLTEKECDKITKEIVPELWTDVTVKNIPDLLKNIKQQILPINIQGWPLSQILTALKQADNDRYKFDTRGFLENDVPIIYQYNKGSFYNWHIDIGNNYPTRKITFIVQLTDSKEYEGGDVEFLNSKTDKEALRQKGTIIMFPSFITHRITKVTKGTNNCIVGWIHGPTFF
jgi:predicted 2-oxoglutarate/Fe(II)-dependent dioxygenase YbiX